MSTTLKVVLILFILSAFSFAVTGDLLYSRLVYLWIFLLATSWLSSRVSLRSLHIERNARLLRSQVGQVFSEQFFIRNNGRLPVLWLELRDRSTLPTSRGSRVFTRIKARESHFYLSRTRLQKRGLFTLGPTQLIAGDVFGLFQIKKTIQATESLLVYPHLVEVTDFPNPPGLLPGGEAIRRKTPQTTTNAAGVREYNPGDAMNRIHWVSTARRNKLIVKEFELDPRADIWIFCDLYHRVQAALDYDVNADIGSFLTDESTRSPLLPSTEEYMVSAAASLAQHYLKRGRAVGLVCQGEVLHHLPPDRGFRQMGKVLETLALCQALGHISFPALLTTHAQYLPRGSVIVLITPSIQPEIAVNVDLLMRMSLYPVVILLDNQSFGGKAGTGDLVTSIQAMGVPVYHIENGANLKDVLNAGTFSSKFKIRLRDRIPV
jgi:uncharacterized protein (DUF58 family)